MCGIVGFVGGATAAMVEYFKWALVCDQIRGTHGTGVVTANRKGEVHYDKKACNAMEYIAAGQLLPETGDQFAIGHNRYATMGAHTDDNSHPFNEDNIVGVHNGTLSDGGRSLSVAGEHRNVDSNYIFCALNRTTNPVEVLENINGAYALVWRDSRTNRIYFARNSERPLTLKVNSVGDFVYASEKEMLEWLTAGSERKRSQFRGDIVDLPVGEIWSFDYTAINVYKTKEVTNFTPKPKPPVAYSGGYYGRSHQKRNATSGAVYKYDLMGEQCVAYVSEIISSPRGEGFVEVRGEAVYPESVTGDTIVIHGVRRDMLKVNDVVEFTINCTIDEADGLRVIARYNTALKLDTSPKKQ